MPKLAIYKSLLESARDRSTLSDEQLLHVRGLIDLVPAGMQRVELADFPTEFLRCLLEDSKLRANQRAVLALHLYGIREAQADRDSIYQIRVGSPIEFGSAFSMLGRQSPNVELRWNGRWYPVVAQALFQEDEQKLAKIVHLGISLGLGTETHDLRWLVDSRVFFDDTGATTDVTVLQVLEQFGLRRVQTSPTEFNMRLVRAERLAPASGEQVWVKGAVLERQSRFWFQPGLGERPLGTPEVPRRAIVESSLGSNAHDGHYGFGRAPNESTSRMPLVRVFSFDFKSYVYADIDDLEVYEYDQTAIARLFLPGRMKDVLATLFATPTERLFGDVIRGKHGGIVILASGNPGVGKTLTAEIYAEIARRPLYVLEFGELGTTVKEIEENLELIFARVVRWQAVLQFDECEIFLSQRGDDLERSAIVGIFLRMLDYYEGLLFLTTNRPETLDHAIRSRVMLRLEYPDLDESARTAIWRTMFKAAGLRLVGGDFATLAEPDVNGRQIRNLVRLARILHPSGEISAARMLDILEYSCR